jgi:hypothetical protein
MKPVLLFGFLLMAGPVLFAQLGSANYSAADNGSLTHGAIATSANAKSAIVNVWWEGHQYGSTNYNGQGNVPGGFEFPCAHAEPPVISVSGDTLISSPAVSYQWYFNGIIINGATSQTLVVSTPGNYSVVIIDADGCSTTSDQVVVGIDDPGLALFDLRLYPNPTSGQLSVEWFSDYTGVISISVLSLLGEVEMVESVRVSPGSGNMQLDLMGLAQGVHLVRLTSGTGEITVKVVKG